MHVETSKKGRSNENTRTSFVSYRGFAWMISRFGVRRNEISGIMGVESGRMERVSQFLVPLQNVISQI
jgi:hypothetical protein